MRPLQNGPLSQCIASSRWHYQTELRIVVVCSKSLGLKWELVSVSESFQRL